MNPAKPNALRRTVTVHGQQLDFDADEWLLVVANPASHQRQGRVSWRFLVGSNEWSSNIQWRPLLNELKELLVALGTGDSALAAPTLGAINESMKYLMRWMVECNLDSLNQITSERSWDYCDFVADELDCHRLARDEDLFADFEELRAVRADAGMPYSKGYRLINLLNLAFREREQLAARGGATLPEAPYSARSAFDVTTNELGLNAPRPLRPIPDDVVVPTLNAAFRLIGAPADDVIQIAELYVSLLGSLDRKKRFNQALSDFQFATVAGEIEPWHCRLEHKSMARLDGTERVISPNQRARNLVTAVVSACCVTIQGLTGIRAHELIGTTVEPDAPDGIGEALTVESSKDGMLNLYYLNSTTLKGGKRKERWLLGSSVAGRDDDPPPVRALRVLARLLAPWRRMSGRRDLLLTFSNPHGMPLTGDHVGYMYSDTMTRLMKEFVHEWVDLSAASPASIDEFKKRHAIRGHRWRSTFALFVFRTSKELLGPLSRHFKHMNTAVTLGGYIGTDTSLREASDGAFAQISSEYFLMLISGKTPLAGGASKWLERERPDLQRLLDEASGHMLQEKALDLVTRHQLFIYPAAYGHCMASYMPSRSRCNEAAGNAGWQRPYPNDAFRTLGTCLGCELLVVTPEHAPFFRARAEENEIGERTALEMGDEEIALQFRKRAKQSRAFLAKLEA